MTQNIQTSTVGRAIIPEVTTPPTQAKPNVKAKPEQSNPKQNPILKPTKDLKFLGVRMDLQDFVKSRPCIKKKEVTQNQLTYIFKFDFLKKGLKPTDTKVIPLNEYRGMLLAENKILINPKPTTRRKEADIFKKFGVKLSSKDDREALKWGAFYDQVTRGTFTVDLNTHILINLPRSRFVSIVPKKLIDEGDKKEPISI